MTISEEVRIGQVVFIKKGRDREKYAVIVHIHDARYVCIADGEKRKFDHMKRKNLLHLEVLPFRNDEIAYLIAQTGRVQNSKLRQTISQYIEQQHAEEIQTKGE